MRGIGRLGVCSKYLSRVSATSDLGGLMIVNMTRGVNRLKHVDVYTISYSLNNDQGSIIKSEQQAGIHSNPFHTSTIHNTPNTQTEKPGKTSSTTAVLKP